MKKNFCVTLVLILVLGSNARAQETSINLNPLQGQWISSDRPNDIIIFPKAWGNVGETIGFWHSPDFPCFSKLALKSQGGVQPFSISVDEQKINAAQNCSVGLFTITIKQNQMEIVYESSKNAIIFEHDTQSVKNQLELENFVQELLKSYTTPVNLRPAQGEWNLLSRPDDIIIFTKQEGYVGEVIGYWHAPNIPCFSKLILGFPGGETNSYGVNIKEEVVLAPRNNCTVAPFVLAGGQNQLRFSYGSSDEVMTLARAQGSTINQTSLETLAKELASKEVYTAANSNDFVGTWVTYNSNNIPKTEYTFMPDGTVIHKNLTDASDKGLKGSYDSGEGWANMHFSIWGGGVYWQTGQIVSVFAKLSPDGKTFTSEDRVFRKLR